MITSEKPKSDQLVHRTLQLEYERMTIIQGLKRSATWPPEVNFLRASVEVKPIPIGVCYSDVDGGVHEVYKVD
jgi:hypothetical protein